MNYFKKSEFACKCGQCDREINIEFAEKLDLAREKAGIPFVINSGCRCEKHNRNVGGSPTSSHLLSIAADISAVNSTQRYRIVNALLETGFRRIGIAKTFIHVDADTEKSGEVIWIY